MFVRKKKNKSGSISIQIISKARGKYRVVKTVGSSSDSCEVERLWVKAHEIMPELIGQLKFDFRSKKDLIIDNFVKDLNSLDIQVVGPELIFGTLFDKIGFNSIPDKLFRDLVLSRLSFPSSKLKTIDYLYRCRGKSLSVYSLYRFLDKLQSKYKNDIEKISFNHTKKLLKGSISVVFYDMTTLYFEARDEDDLRKIGFSKDGKFQKPQIMIGLLVGENGYPIGYDIFEGNTFEGHTLLPILKKIQKKYQLKQPVVIADSALLSKNNLKNLSKQKYKYIIGARIKNESEKMKNKIFDKTKNIEDSQAVILKRKDDVRLIVSYSDKRAKKDAYNRERGLKKLRLRVKSGKLTKSNINNRGYNKFLTLRGKIRVGISEEKIEADKKWDGLKGYVTNTRLSAKKIIENYKHLWQIEKAFRISKTDLKIRPIFHRLRHRIEAHISIAFVAYSIYKELERLLKKHKANISVKKAAELTRTMYELKYTLPQSRLMKKITLGMDDDQKLICLIVQKG